MIKNKIRQHENIVIHVKRSKHKKVHKNVFEQFYVNFPCPDVALSESQPTLRGN
jgi:hypothetical protein